MHLISGLDLYLLLGILFDAQRREYDHEENMYT